MHRSWLDVFPSFVLYHLRKSHSIMSTAFTADDGGLSSPSLVKQNYGKLYADQKKKFVMDIDSQLDDYDEPMWDHLRGRKTNRYSIQELVSSFTSDLNGTALTEKQRKPKNFDDWMGTGEDRWVCNNAATEKAMDELLKDDGDSNSAIAWNHLYQGILLSNWLYG